MGVFERDGEREGGWGRGGERKKGGGGERERVVNIFYVSHQVKGTSVKEEHNVM